MREILTSEEQFLEDISKFYTSEQTGPIAISKIPSIAKELKRKIFAPPKKVIVLIVGGHSTGKSSFANWYFGDNIQRVSAAIETTGFTFITTGKRRQRLDGQTTIRFYDFLESLRDIAGFVENLNTETLLPIQERSNLVTFIDTPGLIPDENRLPFDCKEIVLRLAEHAQRIIVFMEPMMQAFSGPLRDFINTGFSRFGNRMSLYLTKSDTINEQERVRIVGSITQELSSGQARRTVDVRPMWLLDAPPFREAGENQERLKDERLNDSSNNLWYLCEVISEAVKGTVQTNRSQLENDLKDLTRAIDVVLKRAKSRKRIFYFLLALLVLSIAYSVCAAVRIPGLGNYKWYSGLWVQNIGLLALTFFVGYGGITEKETETLENFKKTTAKKGEQIWRSAAPFLEE